VPGRGLPGHDVVQPAPFICRGTHGAPSLRATIAHLVQVASKRVQLNVGTGVLPHGCLDSRDVRRAAMLRLGRRMLRIQVRHRGAWVDAAELADSLDPLIEALEDADEVEAERRRVAARNMASWPTYSSGG